MYHVSGTGENKTQPLLSRETTVWGELPLSKQEMTTLCRALWHRKVQGTVGHKDDGAHTYRLGRSRKALWRENDVWGKIRTNKRYQGDRARHRLWGHTEWFHYSVGIPSFYLSIWKVSLRNWKKFSVGWIAELKRGGASWLPQKGFSSLPEVCEPPGNFRGFCSKIHVTFAFYSMI